MSGRVYRKRYILALLVFFVFLNLAARYPLSNPVPHGSDTLTMLQLSDSLNENDRAGWTLTSLSYFGLFPLSYPSGIPFLLGELVEIAGINPNSTPWVIDSIFSILTLFAGFMLFRAFRMSDETAAVFAGLMAVSPFFLYYTFGQAATRGLLVPAIVLGLFFMFQRMDSRWKRLVLFSVFTVLAFSIHRTAVVVLMIEGVSWIVLSSMFAICDLNRRRVGAPLYGLVVAFGVFVLIWPFIPVINGIYLGIPEVSSSFYEGEMEFRTGFFFEGDSPIVILANLGSNYVGSVGLVLLMLPLVVVALYPRSSESKFRDIFIALVLVSFSFLVWKVQYMQLLLFPFIYLAGGLAVDRVRCIGAVAQPLLIRIGAAGIASRLYGLRRYRPTLVVLFVAVSVAFSVGMLSHRGGGYIQEVIHQYNWPMDAAIDAGIYVGDIDCDESEYIVSNGGLLNRRISWYSGWDSVVSDPVVLRANGYLDADKDDFTLSPGLPGGLMGLYELLYKTSQGYELETMLDDYELYHLSMNVPYGALRLYLENESYAATYPSIQSSTAQIGVVVQLLDLEDRIANPFVGEGTMSCGFLTEVSEKSYRIFVNEEYGVYLAAIPVR